MTNYSFENLNQHMSSGGVYRREMLLPFSRAVDRDLETLVEKGALQKLAGGLYYKPAMSAFGMLPPKDSVSVIVSFNVIASIFIKISCKMGI